MELKSPERAEQTARDGTPARPSLPIPTLMDLETRAARILRDLYAPAGVLINDDLQVLHFHGETEFYLRRVPGEASLNLLRLSA